jgi:hypothetical protein
MERRRRCQAGACRAFCQKLGRDRKPCGSQEREAGKRRRAIEAVDAVIERNQDRKRRERGVCRPDQRRRGALVAALRKISGGAEQHRKDCAEPEMPGDIRLRRRRRQRVRQGGIDELAEFPRHGPGDDDESGEQRRGGESPGRSFATPGDRNGCGDKRPKDRERRRIVIARKHHECRREEIGRNRAGGQSIDAARHAGRPEIETGHDDERDEAEADNGMREMWRERAGGLIGDARKHPEQAKPNRRDRKPAPQSHARQRQGGCRHHREIEVKRPVVWLIGGDQKRRDLAPTRPSAASAGPCSSAAPSVASATTPSSRNAAAGPRKP